MCAVCGAHVDIVTPFAWRCPNATVGDRRHALRFVDAATVTVPDVDAGAGPFGRYRSRLAWDSFASANGMTDAARATLVAALDEPLGFSVTPFARHDALSDALGFAADGGVWLKDETGQVGGSHKARHLFTILLHLRAAELLGLTTWRERPPLAIASCGNAAIAAATLARSVDWPIDVYVPPSADEAVLTLLGSLGAHIVACPRRAEDPPGDPCVHRFREAVASGAVPFSVQGTENVWCLDGGRTIGWEMADAGADLDRLFVQVGGGALAACAAAGLPGVPLHAVQTGASAPLVRAWDLASSADRQSPAARWSSLMWPWEDVGSSAADGILDDETYDWIPVVEAMASSGGDAVQVDETVVRRAHDLLADHTALDASATATAGLAGLLATRATPSPTASGSP